MTVIDVKFCSHDDYSNLRNRLSRSVRYIQLVQIDNNDKDPVIVKANEITELVDKRKTKTWPGTHCCGDGCML